MIAIIGAMQEEVTALRELMTDVTEKTTPISEVLLGKLAGQEVIVAQSGIGKVQAALQAAYLLSNYEIEGIVNIGSAGGLRADEEVGDIVVGTSTTYYDLLFDSAHPRKGLEPYTFTTDASWLKCMVKVLSDLNLPYRQGEIVTGDQFISTEEQLNTILTRCPEAIAVEMEGCAIAQVAAAWKKPSIIIRSLSDITVREGNETDFQKYLVKASKNSAKACRRFIEELAKF